MTSLPSPWRRLIESPIAPLGLLALFAVLIVLTINRFSVWIDESATLELVGPNGYVEIVRRVQYDAHPPLWYIVLKPWLQLFGTHVVAARAQSAVFMLAAFGVWYQFVRTRFSRPLALLTLALMVTNPMLLHYAVEGRMYAFAILLTAVSCVLLTSDARRRWVAYWVCAVAMLYVHYFLAFVVAAEFLYLIVRRREQGLSVRWILIYGVSIVAVFVPWLPHAVRMSSDAVSNGFWIPPVVPSTLLTYVLHAFLHRTDAELSSWSLFPTVIYLATFVGVTVRARRAAGGPHALLWCLLAVLWVCLLALSCKPFVPVFHPRYVIFALPALITLLATGCLMLSGRWRAVVIAILVVGHLSALWVEHQRGFTDTKNYWSMNTVAREISKPIDGELPTVVGTWLFTFMDAKATLSDAQRVVELRSKPPTANHIPDSLYYDKPDWYVLSLSDINARHVWTLEDAGKPPQEVPSNWKLLVTHVRGYVRARLYAVSPR